MTPSRNLQEEFRFINPVFIAVAFTGEPTIEEATIVEATIVV
jgi:hypothetical protein